MVTSNGTDPGSAIIWVVDSPDSNGDGKNCLARRVRRDAAAEGRRRIQAARDLVGAIGTAVKFTMAATSNGMVYVGTRDGNVYGFGITSGAALKSGGTHTFADTPVHAATTAAATVTATRTVTVTGAGCTR